MFVLSELNMISDVPGSNQTSPYYLSVFFLDNVCLLCKVLCRSHILFLFFIVIVIIIIVKHEQFVLEGAGLQEGPDSESWFI